MEIKIRYTWKHTGTGEIRHFIDYIENIECSQLLKVGIFMNPLWELLGRDLWTGWNDKNGNEIYKGDLISEDGSKPYEVIWQSHAGEWIMQSVLEGRGYRNMAYDYAQQFYEIIGNIYTSPELVKK